MKLTEHFTLEEMTFSDTAIRLGIDNSIPHDGPLLKNIRRIAVTLEQVRTLLSEDKSMEIPIRVNSGYRSNELNLRIGGSRTSAHMKALAADIVAPRFGSSLDVAKAIADSDIGFDQLINEGGRWVHIGLSEYPRMQILTAVFPGPKYFPGIIT